MENIIVPIIVALISGAASLLGVVISNNKNAREMDHKLEKSQAITDVKIDELTREVREHNNYAKRVPVLEEKVQFIFDQIKKE